MKIKSPYQRKPVRCQFRIGRRKCKRNASNGHEDRCWEHGKTVRTEHVLINSGGCVVASVRRDGSLEIHPYHIDNCKLCEQPGPHPHKSNPRLSGHMKRRRATRSTSLSGGHSVVRRWRAPEGVTGIPPKSPPVKEIENG